VRRSGTRKLAIGAGKRLFGGAIPAGFKLSDPKTSTRVIIATYERVGDAKTG
jgi:hypothetical protein